MGAFAAHRQARPVQMPHGNLQHGFLGAVVNRQADVDLRDLNVAHDAQTGHIQKLLVCFLLLL